MAESQNTHVLIITFNTIEGIDITQLAVAFSKGMNWIRVAGNSWLVKTVSDAQRWYGRLEPLLGDKHTVFICRLDLSDRQGFLPKSVWDWIDAETPSVLSIPASFADLGKLPSKP